MRVGSTDSKKAGVSLTGRVIAAYGRHFEVEAAPGTIYSCAVRGKKKGVVCGDQVEILPTTENNGVIEATLPRTTLFYRSEVFREKLIAANVTQLIFVLAVVPSCNLELLDRCLIVAENQGIKPLILLNKIDLIGQSEQKQLTAHDLLFYRELGYPVLEISAQTSVQALVPLLRGQTSLLAGQSGVGKSTLLNALVPQALQATAEISEALDSGRHTTTHVRLFRFDADSSIIDSPGFQEFGLQQLNEETLAWGFTEFRPFLGLCKFRDCRHIAEPGCKLLQAAEEGVFDARRIPCYHKLVKGLKKLPPDWR
ncbi:ribosome small subunit-dependent GTPase A [Betaproteobacteria bacterium PRO4]|uniref:ribosome small subunit-dependent GTPase A n=1 Tax=Nitrosomonas sp. TaxID=42353 RepID=UPI002563F0B5|nr:ribosome small subunit-dependent GTPase A [Nitrosomonas sp.]MDL1866352.1 ribosome small subunit-dependent GTPase A [Betaproteobacteria bacterium PRO4]